ncbi:MAG: sigma-70 family RNA polymerase sigma factor [Clostridia bacterium]|nr:sigma-70 family RNA polymerase sigma factor [Clostridia bacterium]
MASIEELIQKSLAGNQDAFRDMVETYKAYVFAIILNFVKEKELAENIAQEVFLQVYCSLPQYRFQNFKAWIGKIAVTKAIDQRRKTKNHLREEPLKECYIACAEEDRQPENPEELLIDKEKGKRVREICCHLPDVYREVMMKYYFEEKNYQQIATEEGVAIKTVESRLYRARILFRQRWGESD